MKTPTSETATSPLEYEFNADEDAIVRSTVRAMRSLGRLAIGGAALRVALTVALAVRTGHGSVLAAVLEAVCMVMFGLLVLRAARPLERIVLSRDRDIEHMMQALGALGRLFRGQAAWLALSLLVAVVAVVVAVAVTA